MGNTIALGTDHGGFPLKAAVKSFLESQGLKVIDLGTNSADPVDYPDYAKAVGELISKGEVKRGIVICGSGVGASIAANKIPGVRAGLCHDTFSAHQGVEDDDMNVLCLGARVIGPELALEIIKTWLNAHFSNKERHVRRLNKVKEIEEQYMQVKR